MPPNVLEIYRKLSKLPMGLGNYAFTLAFCSQAPYFFSIRPKVLDMRPGFASVRMKPVRQQCRLHMMFSCDAFFDNIVGNNWQ